MLRWTNEEEQYLRENYKLVDYTTLSQKLSRSEGAIRAKCFDLGLVKNDRWTQSEIDYLSLNYSDMNTKEIANALCRTVTAINIKAKKLGLKKYEYTCNFDFFEKIDTEQKAYWLGFISSDGWISISDTGAGTIGIELQISDIDHLKKFNKDIGGNYKIDVFEKTCNLSNDSIKLFKMCRIRVYSRKMVNDLIKLGLSNNKTENLTLPNIPQELMRHYIRGFFDGDGCVRGRKKTLASGHIKMCPICDITSKCVSFLEEIRAYLYNNKNICSYIYFNENNIGRLYIHKNQHTLDFLNYIYADSSVFLSRKFFVYEDILNHTNCLAN